MSTPLKVGQIWSLRGTESEIVSLAGGIVRVVNLKDSGDSLRLPYAWAHSTLNSHGKLLKDQEPLTVSTLLKSKTDRTGYIVSRADSKGFTLTKCGDTKFYRNYSDADSVYEDFKFLGRAEIGQEFVSLRSKEVIKITGFSGNIAIVKRRGKVGPLALTDLFKFFKPVTDSKTVKEPEQHSVFYDHKTGSTLYYMKKGEEHLLRNLKTGVTIRAANLAEVLLGTEFFGIHPQVGDYYDNGLTRLQVVDIDKDQAYVVFQGSRDARKLPMLIRDLLVAYKKVEPAAPDVTIKNLIEDGYLTPMRRNIKPVTDLDLSIQKLGRAIRNRVPQFLVLDYAMKDVDATVKFQQYCNKHCRDPWPTLLPQIGDVYRNKFNGVEVRVVKVRRTDYTVSDGRSKWKVNSQALGINYVWVR